MIFGRWSIIASHLPGRTDNDVKNYWNTKLKKKLLAGKISLITNKSSNNSTTFLESTSSLSSVPKSETYEMPFSASQAQISSSILPMLGENGYGITQSLSFDCVSEFGGTSLKNSPIVTSSSQEGSSVSESNSLAIDNRGFLDFSYGVPHELLSNGFWLQEKSDLDDHQAPVICYPNLDDTSCVDIKPQGLHQSIVNQY